MKLSQLAALSAMVVSAFGASIKRDDPEIDIKFTKWDGETECTGDGDEVDIDSGDCHTFDYEFRHFQYERHEHMVRQWHHNDWDDVRCSVVVYEQKDCPSESGRRYCLGSYPETVGTCGYAPFGAYSAKVVCDGSAQVGVTEPTHTHQ